jgi:hypothetical protein
MSHLRKAIAAATPASEFQPAQKPKVRTGILPYGIGDRVPDGSIYAGLWNPDADTSASPKKKYAVFAAPKDITQPDKGKPLLSFHNAVLEVTTIKDLCGHDGFLCANEFALYRALHNRAYTGGWIVPPVDILYGKNSLPDEANLFAHRQLGDFAGTFHTEKPREHIDKIWYWSCTEASNGSKRICNVHFGSGDVVVDPSGVMLSVRPVRLEEASLG